MGYHYYEGSTNLDYFWDDMHTYSIRADKIINTWEEAKDVIARFEADKSQFDYTDYFERPKFHKAVRTYTCMVNKVVSYEEIVFEYQGKEYKTTTKKWSVLQKIRKNADKVISHKQVWADALVDDETEKILAIHKVTNELDLLLGEDLI